MDDPLGDHLAAPQLAPRNSPLAFFISSHGFGHGARASAVMAAVARQTPSARFEIFTQVPEWFFVESLGQSAGGEGTVTFGYHSTWTDVGLEQRDSLSEDLPGTLAQLADHLPFRRQVVDALAAKVIELGCQAILCDISPLGIAVAKRAGLPSVLIENFTWDWIYAGYAAAWPALHPFIDQLAVTFAQADVHIQTRPICAPTDRAALTVGPISRAPRTGREQTRRQLGIAPHAPLVLVTMGGVSWQHTGLADMARHPQIHFLLPGNHSPADRAAAPANVHLLAHNSGLYPPDLIQASDAVIGKIGYSTLAEVYHAHIPYGYVSRPHFAESRILADFVQKEMSGLPMDPTAFSAGKWVDQVPDLLSLPRYSHSQNDGADQVAELLSSIQKE